MRVWSVAREHGRFDGEDLVLDLLAIDDLDQIADAPAVGRAMELVGWAIATGSPTGITLPNFKEFNVPRTAAEKQADYRQRQKESLQDVTAALPRQGNETAPNVTTRERERKEEGAAPSGAARRGSASPRFDDDDQACKAANWFLRAQQKYGRHITSPRDIQTWAKEFDLLFRVDQRDPEEVVDVVEFILADDKRCRFLKSPGALRAKWPDGSLKYDGWREEMRSATASASRRGGLVQ